MAVARLFGRLNRIEKEVPLTIMAGAYHAAGHAVANIVQGLDLHPVAMPVDGVHSGTIVDHTRIGELRPPHEMNADIFSLHRQNQVEKKVRSCLAGRYAQKRFNPRSWRSRHDSGDRQKAMEMLLRATGGSERTASAWMRLLAIQTEDLIDDSWAGVEAVASALSTSWMLTPSEVRTLCWKALHRM